MTASTRDFRPNKGGHGKPGGRGAYDARDPGGRPRFGRGDQRHDRRGGGDGGGFAGDRGDRQRFPATCSDCGAACEVPFLPAPGKPVFCRDCFKKGETSGPRRDSALPRSRPSHPHREPVDPQHARPADPYKAQFEQLNRKLDRILEALSADVD
jgi:CxxC-x17-CxxC domain-containing protein